MKIAAALATCLCLAVPCFAQSQSVMMEDLTGEEVQAAVAGGKTTLIYNGGATHADGPAVAVGKHLFIARYVAQRAAEELGNALVLPINPYAPASGQMEGSPTIPSRFVRAGTISLSDETYGLVTKEVINSAIVAAGFKNAIILGDHGPQQDVLKRVAAELDLEWKPKGVRVYFIPVYAEQADFFKNYLAKQGGVPRRDPTCACPDRQVMIDDAAELQVLDSKLVRLDKMPPDDRKVALPRLGKLFLDGKVSATVRHIRKLTAVAK